MDVSRGGVNYWYPPSAGGVIDILPPLRLVERGGNGFCTPPTDFSQGGLRHCTPPSVGGGIGRTPPTPGAQGG